MLAAIAFRAESDGGAGRALCCGIVGEADLEAVALPQPKADATSPSVENAEEAVLYWDSAPWAITLGEIPR